jgi:putative transposase
MKSLLPLLLRLVRADHAALARQVEYLVVENRMLRQQIEGPVRLTDRERSRLVRFGTAVGPALKDLIRIVRYETLRRWARGVKRKSRKAKRPPGRPRTAASVEKLVVRLARESGWGYTRILGELGKLGIKSVSHTTVRNILKRHGIEPGPERKDPLWETFLRRHAETLWACDFFTANVLTARGMRPASVLAFIHVKTRRVIVTKATFRPTRHWTADAAACLAEAVGSGVCPGPRSWCATTTRSSGSRSTTSWPSRASRRSGCPSGPRSATPTWSDGSSPCGGNAWTTSSRLA